MTPISNDEFRIGMRPFGASVTIITCRLQDHLYGMTATAVCPLSMEPPSLLACINRSASIHDRIIRSEAFCVNLLSAGQIELAERFSSNDSSIREKRFEGISTRALKTGSPVLPGVVAAYDCTLVRSERTFTHTVFVGSIVEMWIAADHRRTLLYQSREFSTTIGLQGRPTTGRGA